MLVMESIKAICWDGQGTIYEDFRRQARIKPGLERTLGILGEEGYQHFLTTGGKADAAQKTLAGAGLEGYFVTILGGGKLYTEVASSLGWDDEETARRMLIIGDSETDKPRKIQAVFIHYPDCIE